MEKGKLGIRLSFYAVAAFILAFLGYSTVLALLAGFVLIVEKNEWASRQVIQAFFLCIFADIVRYFKSFRFLIPDTSYGFCMGNSNFCH